MNKKELVELKTNAIDLLAYSEKYHQLWRKLTNLHNETGNSTYLQPALDAYEVHADLLATYQKAMRVFTSMNKP